VWLLRRYFDHPDLDLHDADLRAGLRSAMAGALLLAGEEEAALAEFRRVLSEEPPRRFRSAVLTARNELIDALQRRQPDALASEALSGLVKDVVARLKPRKALPRWGPGQATNQALCDLLRALFPRKPRPSGEEGGK